MNDNSPDHEVFTQVEPEASTSTTPVKEKKQTTLKRKGNKKLGFTNATKKVAVEPYTQLDSSDEDLNAEWKKVKNIELLELGMKLKVDTTDIDNFYDFLGMVLTDDVQLNLVPSISAIFLLAIAVVKNFPPIHVPKSEKLRMLLNYKQWNTPDCHMMDLKKELLNIPVTQEDPQNIEKQHPENLYESLLQHLNQLYWKTETELECSPLQCITNIWEASTLTYRTYVSRRDLKSFNNYIMKYKWDLPAPTPTPETNSVSYQNTATTSTSFTPAYTPTPHAGASGSREVIYGERDDGLDLDDEFSYLDSRFGTGKASLDISLSKDTQPRSFTAEVSMEDYVYELKIYKKEDIKKLDKDKWYTRVHMKGIGKYTENHPTKTRLNLVLADLMAELKSKKNLRRTKTYTYGQKP